METKNIGDLKANPRNPRTISKFDYEKLVQSIKKFGDLSGIVFNIATGQLVGGHQRIEAFKQLGGVPTITERYEHATSTGTTAIGYVLLGDEKYSYREVSWSLDLEQAANVAANRIQGEFDKDLLAELVYETSQLENGADLINLMGLANDEVSRLLDQVGVSDSTEDETPPLDDANPVVSKLGDIYQLGQHRLMCGDSTNLDHVTKLMNGELADMVWTDPPYNVAYEGKTADALTIENDSFDSSESFYDFLYAAFSNYSAVSKPGASIYICHADSEGLNFRKAMIDSGFLFKQCIVWNKNTMVMGRQDYQWKHEPILYGWKDGASHYFVEDRNLTTVWDFNKPNKSVDHPTMKPLELVKYAINNSSKRDQLVIDFFGGSGSTLISADMLGRKCYTIELDPRYVDVIRKRYAAHTNQLDWIASTPVVDTIAIDEQPKADVAAESMEQAPSVPLLPINPI